MKSEDLAPGDDYAMMREMLTRRFSKLAKEKGELNGWAAPDLVLIDGGPGQLGAAHAVLDELGLSEIKVAAVAKGPDRNAGRERILSPRQGAAAAGAARPCAVLHPDAQGRGASLCHRRASGQAQEGDHRLAARRGAGHRAERASALCSSISARPRR